MPATACCWALKKLWGKYCSPSTLPAAFRSTASWDARSESVSNGSRGGGRAQVLDVGSPKCFGLYLASRYAADFYLTDIDHPSVAEAMTLWDPIRHQAAGDAIFTTADGRKLDYGSDRFHIVFSMSVVEHIAGRDGDREALKEMLRVLKPGGLLLISVPFGPRYVEQRRNGLAAAARVVKDGAFHFFQRIYCPRTAELRILHTLSGARLEEALTVSRRENLLSRIYDCLGENAHALLGPLNPWLSKSFNEVREGVQPVLGSYGEIWSGKDVYGDLLLAWEKRS